MKPQTWQGRSADSTSTWRVQIRSAEAAPRSRNPRSVTVSLLCLLACLSSAGVPAAADTISAQQLVQDVAYNEIQANLHEHSKWIYLDSDKTPGKDTLKLVVETAYGTVAKTLRLNGRPLTPEQEQQDLAKMRSVVNDPDVRAKQRKDSEHDSKEVVNLMRLLPAAFIWTIADETPEEYILHFKPNPKFNPPSYAARVFAVMAGTMTVDRQEKRILELNGTMLQPVEFGWGIFGKIQQGGTFKIVRAQVAPDIWQTMQTHVDVNGHILFFKSITQKEDEITSHYRRSPEGLTLEEAFKMLTDGKLAEEMGLHLEE